MDTPSLKKRHAELALQIAEANHEYHILARPTLTDAEYDSRVREMREIESKVPELKARVLQQVGAPSPGSKVKHSRPMLSLDNVFTPDELRRFFKTDYSIVQEPKIDGLSLGIHYDCGRLTRAVTRGDGKEGDDVTHNALVIPSIPQTITFMGPLEVRGEVYISTSDFEEIVKEMEAEGDEPFSNARNAAAGSLKLKDSVEASKRRLSFIAYHGYGLQVKTQVELCNALEVLGFTTTDPEVLSISDVTSDTMDKINTERKLLPFETDGAVFKINDFKIREELGIGAKSPKWAVAYKFPPEEGRSVLRSCSWQIGRTGTLNPVAIMDPVRLGGATVTRASLCNMDEIRRLNIALNDEIVVVRAAEVIPKVLRVAKRVDGRVDINPPAECPSCGTPLFKDPGLVAYICPNKEGCVAQAQQRIEHAMSKSCLDWDGFGTAQVAEFVSRGFTTLSSVMGVTDVDWMKAAAKKKFIAERERIKMVPLWRKLHALGFDHIGKSFCQDLAFKYGSIMKIVDDYDGVLSIVGPNRGATMFKQIGELSAEIEALDSLGFKLEEVKTEVTQTAATGKVFVITGTLVTGTRDNVATKIEKAGGVVKSSVTKATNYLVVGEEPGANKTAGAKKNGVPQISEEELYAILGLNFDVASDPLNGVNIDDL
jgi:DNA ligase (NAD+)